MRTGTCITREQMPLQSKFLYKGKNMTTRGAYATSIPYQYAMDPTNDVMFAYEMNGHPLTPDHGYPIRSIIPGRYCIEFTDWRICGWSLCEVALQALGQ